MGAQWKAKGREAAASAKGRLFRSAFSKTRLASTGEGGQALRHR